MSLLSLLYAECQAIVKNSAVMLTVFGGVIFYSFLYPLPYAKQIPTEQTVSVVNLDKSSLSFQLERMVDATPQVQVVRRDHSIAAAKEAMLNKQISGLLVIPEHFYKDLMLGKSPVLSYAGDASFFLVYGTVVEGLVNAGATLAAKAKISLLLAQGQPISLASKGFSASSLNMKPTFNASLGYLNYVVPAVFVLILQQTLVMAVGLMVASQKGLSGYWLKVKPLTMLSIRSLLFVVIYLVLAAYYFGFSFDFYGISRLAAMASLFKILLPFLLSSCFIGVLLGTLLPRKELITVVVLISSMPLIFSAGIIWPAELIPSAILWLASLFPSTIAIKAFVGVNQLGAEWHQIINLWLFQWLQVMSWGGVAYCFYRKSLGQCTVK